MVISRWHPFGGAARTRVLVALELLDESYPRELARVLGTPLSGVQAALRSLERDGIVAARSIGRTRLYRFEPRYFAVRELRTYLARLASAEDAIVHRVHGLRRRPGRTGKPS